MLYALIRPMDRRGSWYGIVESGEENMSAVAYPRLIKRVRAVLIDSVVVPVAAVAAVAAGYLSGVTGIWERVALVAVPVLLLEPGLVAWTRGTVGHHLVGVQVTRSDGARLGFVAATLRAIVKYLLGWFSLIFVLTTEKHQAIHDLAVGSIVTHRDPGAQQAYDVLTERRIENPRFVYPSRLYRSAFILLYALALTLAIMVAARFAVSSECNTRGWCGTAESLLGLVLEVAWLVGIGAIIVLGWSGRLPGASRSPRDGEEDRREPSIPL